MMQKEMEEMKDCTFKPETNQKSSLMINNQDYQDKEQFYDRLYREAETKDKYKKSLQMLKDHAETHGCTFQPEINSQRGNNSVSNSARKHSTVSSEDPFSRLHQERENKQRSLVKIENEYDQKFKERHPFQPTRVAKGQDEKLIGNSKENADQRASRLYEEWKDREKKMEVKRAELQKEEESLCKLTLVSSYKGRKPSTDGSISHLQTSQISSQNTHENMQSQMSTSTVAHERLYTQGRDKSKKQQDLRSKVYKEQGYSFKPQVNQEANHKYLKHDENVIDRQKHFLERKENHLKEISDKNQPDFKPQRVTKQSKLAKEWEPNAQENISLGDKLHSKGAEIESKKERMRQEYSNDQNCTFKPQLAKKTEKILRESSSQRNSQSINTKSTTSLNAKNSQREPFKVRDSRINQ